jgi:hypothetical protein
VLIVPIEIAIDLLGLGLYIKYDAVQTKWSSNNLLGYNGN